MLAIKTNYSDYESVGSMNIPTTHTVDSIVDNNIGTTAGRNIANHIDANNADNVNYDNAKTFRTC
jgi:hypothetical protein